jgi:hypothetical protein
MSSSNLMRWSGLAALVGGALLIVSEVLNAALFPAEPGSEVMATDASWFIVQIMGLVALLLIALGLAGLYARQAQETGTLGLIGFVVALSGTLMAFGTLWGEAFLGPFLAEEAPAVMDAEPTGAFAAGVILSVMLYALGWLLFGLASLRARVLPRRASMLLMVGAVLFFVLGVLELPLWTVVQSAAVAWMGYTLWSGTAGESAWTAAEAAT